MGAQTLNDKCKKLYIPLPVWRGRLNSEPVHRKKCQEIEQKSAQYKCRSQLLTGRIQSNMHQPPKQQGRAL
eukprot:2347271-Ditylum_brightwellii.AAC.1